MLDINIFKNYKAKSSNIDIFKHNEQLDNIRAQVKDIYDIDEITDDKLKECIMYHDIGKVVDEFQNDIESKYRKVRHEILSASIKNLSDDERISILTHHKQIKDLNVIKNVYYKDELEEMCKKLNIEGKDIQEFVKQISRPRNKLLRDLNTILLKGYLQYCDHLGSAGVKGIDKGFESIKEFKIPNNCKYNSIQTKVLNLKEPEDILIVAMTGLGKTSTSLYWSNTVQNNEKSKRIYYILPYTASINAMYKDFEDRNLSVAMLHSKAEYFLDKIKNHEDIEDIKELYHLYKYSIKQINICTIFQLIKSVFQCKRFEMLLAQLKNSIFIVDEIHCFETKELCYILEFLKWLKDNLNVHICIMSASIPTCLQNLIKDKLNIKKLITADKNDLITRHRIIRINKNIADNLDKIEKDLDEGKQVLICVNSVGLSKNLYKYFKDKNYRLSLIHGRFNTRDREKAEQDLKNKQLLIGTQSIEVSLDISYDVLYTEIAPYDALLQRFGRINRKGEKGVSNIFIYNDTSSVYDEGLITSTDSILEKIIKNDLGLINEERVQYYLDEVYQTIDEKSYNKYYEYINNILSTIRLGSYSDSVNDDMCNGNSLSVLPVSLYNEYIDYINGKEYLKANALFVNVTQKRYYSCKENFSNKNNYNVIITQYKYNDEVGLDFTEVEDNIY